MTFNLNGVIATQLAQSRLDGGFVLTTLLECLVEHELLGCEADDCHSGRCTDPDDSASRALPRPPRGSLESSPLIVLLSRLDRLRSRNLALARSLMGEAAISAKRRESVAHFNNLADAQGLLLDLIDDCLRRTPCVRSDALS